MLNFQPKVSAGWMLKAELNLHETAMKKDYGNPENAVEKSKIGDQLGFLDSLIAEMMS
jgi:hypothetical protein